MHGTEIGEVVHFDYLHLGEGTVIDEKLSVEAGFSYLSVIMEDVGNYVWLMAAVTCNVETTVRGLLQLCAALGARRVLASDTATHFRNNVMRMMAEVLGIMQWFSAADSGWTNDTVESMTR